MSRKIAVALYIAVVALVAGVTFTSPGGALAAPPKDLKFYPKKIKQAHLYKEMRLVMKGLGVKCAHCHQMTPRRQFAKNTKNKKIGLQQMFLVRSINEKIKKFHPEVKVKVSCYTCHRGKKTPVHKPEDGDKPLDMSKEKLSAKFEELTKWINKDLKKTFPKKSKKFKVTCYTCHRGEKKPISEIPEVDEDE